MLPILSSAISLYSESTFSLGSSKTVNVETCNFGGAFSPISIAITCPSSEVETI